MMTEISQPSVILLLMVESGKKRIRDQIIGIPGINLSYIGNILFTSKAKYPLFR